MEEVVIVSGARTPVGKLGGKLSTFPAPQLGALAIKAAIVRAGIAADAVDYVVMGNVLQAGEGQAPARQAMIGAGIPATRASALTVNVVCASGLSAIIVAAQSIQTGMAEVVVAGGMENMSRAPHLLPSLRSGVRLGHAELLDSMISDGLMCPFEHHHMGNAAEAIAAKYGITREEQDAFALRSHEKALATMSHHLFDDEIVPVEVESGRERILVNADEGPRPDSSLDALARLRTAFQDSGTVTAGNASQISDGAAAVVVMSTAAAQRLGATPIASITAYVNAPVEPYWLFEAPVKAAQKLLQRTESRLSDWDIIEVNEAYAAQTLANGKALGWDWERVNPHGGAIALGHPIGCSGARIMVTLLHELRQTGLRRGMELVCHGGGGAVGMTVERV